MTRLLRALLVSVLLVLSGCQLTDYTIAKRSAIDKEIATARADTEARLNALGDRQLSLLKQVTVEQQQREQAAADYLFKGSVVASTLKTPTRPEMVMGQSIQQTAAQLPAASPAVQAKTFQDLKTELDEARISTDALKAQYETELGKARAEGAAKDKALTDIAAALKHVDEEKVTVLTKANATEAQLSDARKAVDDTALAAQAKELANAKSVQAIKTKMSAIAGGLGLLFLLGAIYSPVFKDKLGLAAGVLLLAAVAIWYVEAWMVAVVVGLGMLTLVGWAAKNHYIESKTASNVYHALNEVQTTAKADYDKVVAPVLAAWQTTYDKKGNTIPDQTAIAHVDSVLMATGAK